MSHAAPSFSFLSRALDLLTGKSASKAKKPGQKRPVRLEFEHLEKRWLPANFFVSALSTTVSESTRYVDINITRDSIFGTGSATYATSDGSAAAGSDYASTSGTVNFAFAEATKVVRVPVHFDQDSESNETFTFALTAVSGGDSIGSPGSVQITITDSSVTTWTVTGGPRVTDPLQGARLPFGDASIGLQAGDFSVSHGFDYGRGGAVFEQPALVYHSDSIGIKPVLEVTVATPGNDAPTNSEARLTWDGGSPGSWVTFSNPAAGDTNWVYGLQVAAAVSSTGAYPFTLDIKEHFSDSKGDVVRSYSGTALVVVNDGAYGTGWWVAGLDRLDAVTGGMMLVYGSGGARLFTGSGPTYTSPANDYGTLVKNVDNSYTYTSKGQDDWNFDSGGKLTSIVDPHGLTRTFTYDGGNLSTVTEPDLGVTTFTYDGGKLATIVQPGNRTITFTYSGNDLTTIADADGALRSFSYSSHRLTNEAWDTALATMTYSGTTGALTNLDRGGSNTLALTDSAGLTLSTSPLKRKGDVNTSFTDSGLTLTTVTLDIAGRMLGFRGNLPGGGAGAGVSAPLGDGVAGTILRDAAGNVTKYTDALERVTTYTYDGNGDLTQVEHPDNSLETFTYDSTFHTVLTHQDTLSNLTTYTYNGTGDLTSVKDALNHLTTFTYTSGQVETVQDALNHVTTYTYDNRRLRTATDALTKVTTYSYDASGNLQSVEDPLHRLTTYAYDARHRLTKTTDALSGVTTYVYDARGNLTRVEDPLSRVTSYTYNAQGFNTTVTEALGSSDERTTTYTYLAIGWVNTVKDALNHVTTYTYTVYGDVATVTDPLSHTTTYGYDNERQLLAVTNPLSQTTSYTYNSRGWVTEVQDPLNYRTTYTYDTEGNLTKIKDANNGVTTLTYDALNRRVTVKDPLGHTTTIVYDEVGNVTAVVDPLSNRTTYSYDALDRLQTVQDAGTNVTTYVYDDVGNLVAVTDPLSHTTTYVYDELHRRVNTVEANATSKTTFVYDAAGQLINLIDPDNNQTTFVYDSLGRQTTEIDPLSKRITYTYDAADRLTQKKDRLGRTIDYSYDNADRLTGEVWKDSGGTTTNTATYTYDNADRLLTARDGQGAYTFTYDAVGQVLTQKDLWGNTLTFTYDAVGNRTKVQDSLGGLETSTYDAANRLTARKFSGVGGSSLRLEFTYTAADQTENVKRYNASSGGSLIGQTTYTYDSVLRMSGIKSADGSANVLSHYTYTYDAASRLTAEILGGVTVSYDYDVRNQLTDDSVHTYTYDAAGNRTSNGASIGTGNRLQSDNSWTYTYDDEGNLTQKVSVAMPTVTWTYSFDVGNRMTSAVQSGGGNDLYSVTYAYDVFGNRIQEEEDADGAGGGSAVTTRFALEGYKVRQDTWGNRSSFVGTENWDVWADLDGSNNLKIRYVRGDVVDELFSRVKSDGTVAWYLIDRMGSVRHMVDAAGAVQDTIAYDGFGSITGESAPTFGDRYKWTGRERNSNTDFQYNRHRYLSVQTGRWVTEDPLGLASGDYNVIRYVGSATTSFLDPSGLLQGSGNGSGAISGDKKTRSQELVAGLALGIRPGTLYEAAYGFYAKEAYWFSEAFKKAGRSYDEQEAARHMLWQALLTVDFGPEIAQKIGNIHEGTEDPKLGQPSRSADSIADQINNEAGRKIGKEANKHKHGRDAKKLLPIIRDIIREEIDKGNYPKRKEIKKTYNLDRE